MKRIVVIAALALVALVSVGLVWLAVKQQQRQVTTPRVFAVIDLDHNHQLSPGEQQAYAERVLHDLSLELVLFETLTEVPASKSEPDRAIYRTHLSSVRILFNFRTLCTVLIVVSSRSPMR